jgi:hypothetical protein
LGPNGRVMSRYAMPMVPVVLLMSALGLVLVSQRVAIRLQLQKPAMRTLTLVALSAVVLAYPFIETLKLDWLFAQPDTRSIARNWILSNIQPNQAIALGPRLGGIQLPPNYGVLLLETGPNNLPYQFGQFPPGQKSMEVQLHDQDPRTKVINVYRDVNIMKQLGIRWVVLFAGHPLFANPAEDIQYYQQHAKLAFFVPSAHPMAGRSANSPRMGAVEPMDAFYIPFDSLYGLERPGPTIFIFDLSQPPEKAPQ